MFKNKKRKFKLVPYDEIHNIYMLREVKWKFITTYVSCGREQFLVDWVEPIGGEMIN